MAHPGDKIVPMSIQRQLEIDRAEREVETSLNERYLNVIAGLTAIGILYHTGDTVIDLF